MRHCAAVSVLLLVLPGCLDEPAAQPRPPSAGVAPPSVLADEPVAAAPPPAAPAPVAGPVASAAPECSPGHVYVVQTGDTAVSAPALRGTTIWHPWTSGRALALHGDDLFALDRDNGRLVVVDRVALQVRVSVDVGGRPEQVVVGPDGTAFVSLRAAGQVLRFAPGASTATAWQVGTEPVGLALSADATRLYVVVAGAQQLRMLDAKTGALLGQGATGPRPLAVAVNPFDLAVITHQAGPARTFDLAALAGAGLTGKPPATGSDVALGGGVLGSQCFDLDGQGATPTRAVAASVDPETGDVRIAHVVVASGSHDDAVLAAQKAQTPNGAEGNDSYGGGLAKCAPLPRPFVEMTLTRVSALGARLDPLWGMPVQDDKGLFVQRFDQPSDVAHHPTLALAFVSALGTDNVAVLRTEVPAPHDWTHVGLAPAPVAEIRTGQGPRAVALTADGKHAYVLNAHGFSISEVDLQPLLGLAGNQVLALCPSRTAAIGQDPLPESARLGRRLFHHAANPNLAPNNRFACATCHLDGTEDKQVWFIADGPRQTPALAGRLQDTAPFNWQGSEGKLSDNMKQTIQRMGGAGLSETELAALETFLLVGLPPPPNPHLQPGGLTPQQAEGKTLFQQRCASCHVPGPFTDGKQHDVGTASPTDLEVAEIQGKDPQDLRFDTPSLRGLHYTAPYLHDGSAATLQQVLQLTEGKMADTADLGPAQIEALVAYLLTL